MPTTLIQPEFKVEIDYDKCHKCGRCVQQCGWGVYSFNERPIPDDTKCRACHRCVTYCPAHCITIKKNDLALRDNANWSLGAAQERVAPGRVRRRDAHRAWATTSPTRTSSTIWSSTRARSRTRPSTRCASRWSCAPTSAASPTRSRSSPTATAATGSRRARAWRNNIELDTPIIFSPMSYGSVSLNVHKSLAMAAERCGILMNTGEGGLHADLYPYQDNVIVQVASGRFGVNPEYLQPRRRDRDQGRPGRQAGHRRPPARREDQQGSLDDPHDPAGHRRDLARRRTTTSTRSRTCASSSTRSRKRAATSRSA